MGDNYQTLAKQAEVQDFHAALVERLKEKGRLGILIPISAWQDVVVRTLGSMTRRSVDETTWCMARMGLLEHREREGVILLETPPEVLL